MLPQLTNNRILLITPERFVAQVEASERIEADIRENEYVWDGKTDWYGDPLPEAYRVGDIAVIEVFGVICAGLPKIYKAFGYCDPNEIAEQLRIAIADAGVREIVMHINSPGGTVAGVMELAALVALSNKRIYIFTDDQLCSAAYWIGAGAYSITATPSADVGSISAYCAVMDWSKMFELCGVSIFVAKSGKYKAMGLRGTSLTDDQKALLQSDIEEISSVFKGDVTRTRKRVTGETMEGQSFYGYRAAELGLVDDLQPSFDDFMQKLNRTRKP
jgi:signal peptide peptidase SppA